MDVCVCLLLILFPLKFGDFKFVTCHIDTIITLNSIVWCVFVVLTLLQFILQKFDLSYCLHFFNVISIFVLCLFSISSSMVSQKVFFSFSRSLFSFQFVVRSEWKFDNAFGSKEKHTHAFTVQLNTEHSIFIDSEDERSQHKTLFLFLTDNACIEREKKIVLTSHSIFHEYFNDVVVLFHLVVSK